MLILSIVTSIVLNPPETEATPKKLSPVEATVLLDGEGKADTFVFDLGNEERLYFKNPAVRAVMVTPKARSGNVGYLIYSDSLSDLAGLPNELVAKLHEKKGLKEGQYIEVTKDTGEIVRTGKFSQNFSDNEEFKSLKIEITNPQTGKTSTLEDMGNAFEDIKLEVCPDGAAHCHFTTSKANHLDQVGVMEKLFGKMDSLDEKDIAIQRKNFEILKTSGFLMTENKWQTEKIRELQDEIATLKSYLKELEGMVVALTLKDPDVQKQIEKQLEDQLKGLLPGLKMSPDRRPGGMQEDGPQDDGKDKILRPTGTQQSIGHPVKNLREDT